MVNYCIVPGCESNRGCGTKSTVFRFPQEPLAREQWKSIIGVSQLKADSRVCYKHFRAQDIERHKVYYDALGNMIYKVALPKPRLKKNALPISVQDINPTDDCRATDENFVESNASMLGQLGQSINPHCRVRHILQDLSVDNAANTALETNDTTDELIDKLESVPNPTEFVTIGQEKHLDKSHSRSSNTVLLVDDIDQNCEVFEPEFISTPSQSTDQIDSQQIPDTPNNGCHPRNEQHPSPSPEFMDSNQHDTGEDSNDSYNNQDKETSADDIFCADLQNLKLPQNWFISSSVERGYISIFEIIIKKEGPAGEGPQPNFFKKSIFVDKSMKVCYYVLGKRVLPEKFSLPAVVNTVDDLQLSVDSFSKSALCSGISDLKDVHLVQDKIGATDQIGTLRHTNCSMISLKSKCQACSKVTKTISQRKRRMSKRNTKPKKTNESDFSRRDILHVWKRKVINLRATVGRKNKRIKSLKQTINEFRSKIQKADIKGLLASCKQKNIPEIQQQLLEQIVKSARCKSAKGNRYNDDWIMTCLLLHIQSPKQYRLIQSLKLLPLPNERTIRRYISLIDVKCGFDPNFFELFKKHMDTKTPRQRHGLLLLDEISLRESISVNSSDLSYHGLVNKGDDGEKASTVKEKAKSALVLMFQPLADTYTQPIAVFASSGPIKGIELAKIVNSSIFHLEKAGALIHGVIGDGIETNRKMFRQFGVTGTLDGTKNWCVHPVDRSRKLFFFSDTPHLIKNVRNRVYQHDLKIDEYSSPIKWNHFRILYATDYNLSASKARVCPKITKNHIELTNSLKMRVRLATQILSKSAADGFKTYKHVPGLKDSHETRIFCLVWNGLFDALNRKHSHQGLSVNNQDYLILQQSLLWLNNWEMNMRSGRIKDTEFLTENTAEGLRLTILSTMHLCQYMNSKYSFSYILTGKINQDALEKFFGSCREACGDNDHPATPTFLMIYRLLSVFSILKPPRYGNCSIDEDVAPKILITLSDLKEIYKSEKKSLLQDLKDKLDGLIEHDEWEFSDVVDDHDYSEGSVIDCVIYYVTGYLIRQLQKRTKCAVCKSALVAPESSHYIPQAELVNLKNRRSLIHANLNFFRMVDYLETVFAENIESVDVYDRTVNQMLDNYKFTFPCREHATDILAYSIKYYLCMRMRQFTYQENSNAKKLSADQRKKSHHYKS